MDVQNVVNRARAAFRPAQADITARTLIQELAKLTEAQQQQTFIGDRQGGFVFVYSSPTAGNYVLEVIQAGHGQDNVATLYQPHPLFNERAKVMELRKELIEAIEQINDAAPGTIGAFDKQRGREVLLGELASVQLLGMLEERQIAKVAAAAALNRVEPA